MDLNHKPPTLDELIAKCEPEAKRGPMDDDCVTVPPVGNEIILEQFHYHEAIDRTHIQLCQLESSLANHPVIEAHPELKSLYEEVSSKLADLYQKIGKIQPSSSHNLW